MGAIRKTLSVTTLGLVPFRSKKERVARAEMSSKLAEAELQHEREARESADRRLEAAERRARDAEKAVAAASARRRSRRDRRRRRDRGTPITATLGDKAAEVIDLTDSKLHDLDKGRRRLSRKARKRAKAARKEAARATSSVKHRAEEMVGG